MAGQLRMVHRNLGNLRALQVPDGYELRTYLPGDEEHWVEIMKAGGWNWTVEQCHEQLTGAAQFIPEGLFFVTYEGKPVGSACAWRESADEWNTGFLHMVCVEPVHRGKHLGDLIVLAVLRFFAEKGFKEVWLSTDDWRVPAIGSYLKLGYEPAYMDDTHKERWDDVFEKLDTPR